MTTLTRPETSPSPVDEDDDLIHIVCVECGDDDWAVCGRYVPGPYADEDDDGEVCEWCEKFLDIHFEFEHPI